MLAFPSNHYTDFERGKKSTLLLCAYDNWDAVEDLIFDIILPEKVVFSNWIELEKKLPEDAAILRYILQRYSNGRCTVIYS